MLTELLTDFPNFGLSRAETALFRASGVGWLYLIVMCIEECPKSFDTVAISIPERTRRVAKVCLSV